VIDDRVDVFPGHERFVHALLGLLSYCERFVSALERESIDQEICSDRRTVEVALGVVSLSRSVRAELTLGALDALAPSPVGAPVAQEVPPPGSLLR